MNASLSLKTDAPCPVLIGGLGPLMRRIAGELADGTLTWMTGARALGGTLVPEIRAAASRAGRPAPRIVAGLPIALTNDPAAAREAASKLFALYGTLPSYRAMLDLEGAAAPGDIVIAGDERAIESAIRSLAAAGVTDLSAAPYPVRKRRRRRREANHGVPRRSREALVTSRELRFETRAIHAGQEPDEATGATIVPVYQTVTFTQDADRQPSRLRVLAQQQPDARGARGLPRLARGRALRPRLRLRDGGHQRRHAAALAPAITSSSPTTSTAAATGSSRR